MIRLQPRLDDCWLRRLYSGTISTALSSPVFLTGHWAQSGESVQQVNETVIDAVTLRYCHHRLLETTDFVFIVWSAGTQHGSNDVQCGLNINCLADNAHKQVEVRDMEHGKNDIQHGLSTNHRCVHLNSSSSSWS